MGCGNTKEIMKFAENAKDFVEDMQKESQDDADKYYTTDAGVKIPKNPLYDEKNSHMMLHYESFPAEMDQEKGGWFYWGKAGEWKLDCNGGTTYEMMDGTPCHDGAKFLSVCQKRQPASSEIRKVQDADACVQVCGKDDDPRAGGFALVWKKESDGKVIGYYALNASPELVHTAICRNSDERNEYQREDLESVCEKVNEVANCNAIIVELAVWVKNEPGIEVTFQSPVWTYACHVFEGMA